MLSTTVHAQLHDLESSHSYAYLNARLFALQLEERQVLVDIEEEGVAAKEDAVASAATDLAAACQPFGSVGGRQQIAKGTCVMVYATEAGREHYNHLHGTLEALAIFETEAGPPPPSSNYIKFEYNVYQNILECVNLYKIISKYDTIFDFGVKIDIFGFCNFLVIYFLTFLSKMGSLQHVSDKVLRAK